MRAGASPDSDSANNGDNRGSAGSTSESLRYCVWNQSMSRLVSRKPLPNRPIERVCAVKSVLGYSSHCSTGVGPPS
ncbi:Uncharacterised protein [Mycobacterium tuberculosis]|nr:Uncharacterised protein [Mycobacterium tuberculosis]